MTWGRQANHALIVDPTGAVDPGERLAEIITRPAAAHSALAVQAQLHRAAGVEPPYASAPVELTRQKPSVLLQPNEPTFVEPTLEEKIRLAQQRLDQVQQRAADRTQDRSLGL